MSLLQRTIKLTLALVGAIYLADLLGLAYSTAAGIIAILSVLDTRRSSAKVALQRLGSTLLALTVGSLALACLGFHLGALALYMALYVPLAYTWQLEVGIAPSTVLVTHLMLEERLDWAFLGNELALFLIGAGVALFLNLYMPSKQAAISVFQEKVETSLAAILLRFREFLIQGDGTNEALLIRDLEQTLKTALNLVYHERHNQVFSQTNYQVHYFEMRAAQNKLLASMAETVKGLQTQTPEALILAQLFEEVAGQLSEMNSGLELLADMDQFVQTFRQRPLPQTRQEFENRAILFQLLNDLKRFIQLKVDFYCDYKESWR